VDYMLLEQAIPVPPGFHLSWYTGAGASVGLWGGDVGAYIFPHGLVGIEYALPGLPFRSYTELQAGLGISTAGAGRVGPDIHVRGGLIFGR